MPIVADPAARIIDVDIAPVSGIVEVDVQTDIYSKLKDDWRSTAALQALRFPFRTFGDPLGEEQIGPFVFFDNISGWRLRPYDDDHELRLFGNLIPESVVQGISVPTIVARAGRTILVSAQLSAQSRVLSATEALEVTKKGVTKLQFLVESSRERGGFGETIYWDPMNGDDANDGSKEFPVLTWGAADALVVSGRHDVVFVLHSGGEINYPSPIVVTKGAVSIRAPGRVVVKPTVGGVDAVTVTAAGVHMSGLVTETPAGGGNGFVWSGAHGILEDCEARFCSGDGVVLLPGSAHTDVRRMLVRENTGDGVRVEDVSGVDIYDCDIHSNRNNVRVEATAPPTPMRVELFSNRYNNASQYGVSVGAGVQGVVLGKGNVFANNALGAVLDEDDFASTHLDPEVLAVLGRLASGIR